MNDSALAWSQRRSHLIAGLARGELGGTYADACVIAATAFSEIASTLWPGDDRIDRNRFVETWHEYTRREINRNLISVPVLIEWLEKNGQPQDAKRLIDHNPMAHDFGNLTRIVTWKDVDLCEQKIHEICPALEFKIIRSHSYANLFYREVRSAYTHTSPIGKYASSFSMTLDESGVSYENKMHVPHRRIHFEVDWLIQVLNLIVQNLEPDFRESPRTRPAQWWLNGA